MEQFPVETNVRRSLWTRLLLMILMAIFYSVSGTVLLVVAVIQIGLVLFTDAPNPHLIAFGRNLGTYFKQIVTFQTFATEELPFPFSDWPA